MESKEDFATENKASAITRPWYKVNTHTLPGKAACITAFSAFGSYQPNAGVFLFSIGLSKTETGIIGGVRTIAEILGNPLWGAVADKTRAPKWVLLFLIAMSLCLITSQPWVAHHVQPVETYEHCVNTTARPLVTPTTTFPDTTEPTPTNTSHPKCETRPKAASPKLFYTMLALVPLSYVFAGSLPNNVETRVLKLVQSSPVPATFGQQRYFGSVFFGVSSVIAGLLADNIQHAGMSSYTAIFYWYALGLGLFGIVTLTVFFRTNVQTHEQQKNEDVNVSKLVISTLKSLDIVLFFITILVTGIASGVLYGFLFIYLEEFNASKFEMGLNILLSCAVELLVFPFAAPIIKFVRGNRFAMAIGLFAYFPRFLMVSYFRNLWLILSSHILHGLCFALFWAAAVDDVYQFCPKEILTTMLGILNSVYAGLGQLIANFLGGVLFDAVGGRMLYLIVAITCLIWSALWTLYVAISHLRGRRSHNIN